MTVKTIEYMKWFKTRGAARIDLCSSGVERLRLKDLDLDLAELEIHGRNCYGFPPLLEAVAERYGTGIDNVVTTLGTSSAIFLACGALLEPRDEVIIEIPAYESLAAVPGFFGAKTVRLERDFDRGFAVDPDRLEDLIGPRTRLIILSNLHNPSGAYLSGGEIEMLSGIAGRAGASLLIDEVYLEFMDGDRAGTSFHRGDNIVVVSSLTKVFGLGGLRCGWILAPAGMTDSLRRLVDYTNVEGVFIGESIAARIFPKLDALKDQTADRLHKNRLRIGDFIRQESGLSWVEPAAGAVCFPRMTAGLSGDELADVLLRDFSTALVPGRFFGDSRHFRLGFAASPEVLEAALENISAAMAGSLD